MTALASDSGGADIEAVRPASSWNDLAVLAPVDYLSRVTAVQIIDEIKRLPPAEQARVARFVGELNPPLTPDELGYLAEELANESDSARAQALKQRIVSGFYGNVLNA